MHLNSRCHQGGAILLLALVMLAAATILALSGLSNSAMQGRMVAASADGFVALSSADMALKKAELKIISLSSAELSNFNAAPPLYAVGGAVIGNAVFNISSWAGSVIVDDNPDGVGSGEYLIELMNDSQGYSDRDMIKANNILGAKNNKGANIDNNAMVGSGLYTFHTFRVVAKGYGRSKNTVRVLEAYYRRGF